MGRIACLGTCACGAFGNCHGKRDWTASIIHAKKASDRRRDKDKSKRMEDGYQYKNVLLSNPTLTPCAEEALYLPNKPDPSDAIAIGPQSLLSLPANQLFPHTPQPKNIVAIPQPPLPLLIRRHHLTEQKRVLVIPSTSRRPFLMSSSSRFILLFRRKRGRGGHGGGVRLEHPGEGGLGEG